MTPNEQLFAYQGAHLLSQQVSQAVASETLTYTGTHDSILFFDYGTGNEVGTFLPAHNGLAGRKGVSQKLMAEMFAAAERVLDGDRDARQDVGSGLDPRLERFFADFNSLLGQRSPVGTRLVTSDEDKLNRYCIFLAELEKVFRAGYRESSPLSGLRVKNAEILADWIDGSWLDDLRELSWRFYDHCGDLLALPSVLNLVFDGSAHVGGADADLIVDGTLLDLKTSIKAEFKPEWVWQLLGYALLDYSDDFQIAGIGLYMARQGLLLKWNLEEAIGGLSGQSKLQIQDLRTEFRKVAKA